MKFWKKYLLKKILFIDILILQITALPDPDRIQVSPAKDLGIVGATVSN